MKTKLAILIALLVLSIIPARAQSADQYIAQGESDLGPVADNLWGANTNFAAAVALSPTNQTANVLWAATRLLTVPQTPAGSNFLNSIGFSVAGRDIYNWTSAPPKDVNGNLIFPAGLNSSTAVAFALATMVPTLQACDTNLAAVKDPAFTLFLPAAETTGIQDVTLDYGDIQMLRAMGAFGQFAGYTVNAQNANVVVPQVENAFSNNTFTIQWLLSTYPSLGSLVSAANLTLSKTALTNAIAHYFAASDFIRNVRAPGFTGLFNLTTNDVPKEAEFRTDLTNFLASLNGPAIIDTKETFYINSSNYFSGAKSPRSLVPQFTGNAYNIDTVPDYTFGGIVSGVPDYVTEELLRMRFPSYAGIYIGDNGQFYNNGPAVSDNNGNVNGSFAVFVSTNGQTTLVGHDDGDGLDDGSNFGFFGQFTVNAHGEWSFSNSVVSGFGNLDRGGDFSGELDSTNGVSVYLNALEQTPYGAFQGPAGYFTGSFSGSQSGGLYLIVAADGEVFYVPLLNNNVSQTGSGGSSQFDGNNHFIDIQIGGSTIRGTLNTNTPSVSGTFTNSDLSGGTFTVNRSARIQFDTTPVIVVAPGDQHVEPGSNATFTVTGSGSPPLCYQWAVNGTNIYGATNKSLTISNCTFDLSGNSYSVTLNNVAGFTNGAASLFVGDAIRPSVSITNLAAGLQVSNANFTVMGTAADNVAVAEVFYNLNNTGWAGANSGDGFAHWSALLALQPGTNMVSVYAEDTSGNLSNTNTVNFVYVQSATLTVQTNGFGWGSLNPNYNGAFLQIGKSYSITATAVSGFVFTNWTGGTGLPLTFLTNGATVTFLMQSNLMLQANFLDVTKPTLNITNLTAGQQVSNSAFTVKGVSWDNVAIANVRYNFNSSGWSNATPGIVSSNWSVAVMLLPGTNTIAAYAVDASGNFSTTNAVAFKYVVSAPLTVTTNSFGWGTLNPNDSGALLQVGTSYSITATAASGFVFTNWTGGTGLPLTFLTNGATVTFLMQSNLMLQANFLDVTKPTLNITNLTAGQQVSNSAFTVKGVSWDNVAIANVRYNFNSSGWSNATPGIVSSNWSVAVMLLPGTNTIAAYAADASGNLSTTNAVAFKYVVSAPLTVTTNGVGSLNPNYSGALLQVGTIYSVTATPAGGFVFTNWVVLTNGTLSTRSNNATLQFLMSSNLALQVNFRDITLPTLSITAPPNSQRMTNALAYLTGTAGDNWKVVNVLYQLNSNGWNQVTTTNGFTNWTQTVKLIAGTNTLRAYAMDMGGNLSLTSSVSVYSTNAFKMQLALSNAPAAGNGLSFKLELSPGMNGHIQVSTDLLNWTTLTNFVGTNGSLNLFDPSITNQNHKFYRAVVP